MGVQNGDGAAADHHAQKYESDRREMNTATVQRFPIGIKRLSPIPSPRFSGTFRLSPIN